MRRHLFAIILVSAAILGAGLFYLFFQRDYSDGDFELWYFGGKVSFFCRQDKKEGVECSWRLKRDIRAIMEKMEQAGYRPLDSIRIRITQYEKCGRERRRNVSCLPFFAREEGKNIGHIFIAKAGIPAGHERRILAHEITHALLSKHGTMVRIVSEFFAVYSENLFSADNMEKTNWCFGREWNQPALATEGGDFVFPPSKVPASHLLSLCRYGQLTWVGRELYKKFPSVYWKLWSRASAHSGGRIDLAVFRRWLEEADPAAAALAGGYYVLRQSDHQLHPAMARSSRPENVFVVFAYRTVNAEKSFFAWSGTVFVTVERKKKIELFSHRIEKSLLVFAPSYFLPGDKVTLETLYNGRPLLQVFHIR